MFQPWSGNSPSFCSVDNVTSLLSPPHRQLFSGSFHVTHCVPTPPTIRHPQTEQHCHFISIVHLLFQSLIAQAHKRPLLLASTVRPCDRCLAALDLLPRSLLAHAAPHRESVPAVLFPILLPPFWRPQSCQRPCQPLWVIPYRFRPSSAIPQTTLPPLSGLDLRPIPCRSRGGSCLQSLASCRPPSYFLLTRSYDDPYIGIFFWFIVCWVPFWELTICPGVSTPWKSPPLSLVPELIDPTSAIQAPLCLVPPPSPLFRRKIC